MALDDILKQVPVDEIAAKLGVSREEAEVAVQQGGAVLLGGLAKNAESESGSAAIREALKKHEGSGGAARVDDIDQADGGKIVSHILGAKKAEVTEKLTKSEATPGIDFGKLLPILAPIVMGLIANATKSRTPESGNAAEGSGGLSDIIGGILGGGSGSSGSSGGSGGSGGGGLGDILGGLLGGRK